MKNVYICLCSCEVIQLKEEFYLNIKQCLEVIYVYVWCNELRKKRAGHHLNLTLLPKKICFLQTCFYAFLSQLCTPWFSLIRYAPYAFLSLICPFGLLSLLCTLGSPFTDMPLMVSYHRYATPPLLSQIYLHLHLSFHRYEPLVSFRGYAPSALLSQICTLWSPFTDMQPHLSFHRYTPSPLLSQICPFGLLSLVCTLGSPFTDMHLVVSFHIYSPQALLSQFNTSTSPFTKLRLLPFHRYSSPSLL